MGAILFPPPSLLFQESLSLALRRLLRRRKTVCFDPKEKASHVSILPPGDATAFISLYSIEKEEKTGTKDP